MLDLGDEIRRLFDPAEPVGLDEVEETSRRRRRRRRRVLAASSTIALTAGIAAAVQVGRTPTMSVTVGTKSTDLPAAGATTGSTVAGVTTGVVPWADKPAASPGPAQPNPPPPAFPACHAGQLSAASGPGFAAMGNDLRDVVLTNISGSDCSLSGYPTSLVGVHPDGTHQVLSPFHDGYFEFDFAWPANLHPGQSTQVGIGTTFNCLAGMQSLHQGQSVPAATVFSGEIIGLPGGGTVQARAPFNTICGVGVTTFGVREPQSTQMGSYPGVSAHADLPGHVAAGTVMNYTVTLTNNTASPVALSPCPIYQETLAADPIDQHTYQLNCTTVHAIPPHGSVTYAMRMPVPYTPGPGTRFGWSIPNSESATTSSTIDIISDRKT